MKLMSVRLFLDDLYSFLNGWYFRFASGEKEIPYNLVGLYALADFTTDIRWKEEMKEMNSNKMNNMKLGCKLISGVKLKPGEVFSLRRFLGNPTYEKGFKDGPMVVNGRLQYAVGGGLCQVSTTLFNAALMANLKILQKFNHSVDVWGENRLVELGRDAVYVFGRRDLKFKNIHGSDIYIVMNLDEENKKVNCKILSKKKLEYDVLIKSNLLKELKPIFAENTEMVNHYVTKVGWIVLTERYIGNDGTQHKLTYRKREKYKPSIQVGE
ncbi:MAG: VanW family protein [Clostridia bacterium]|nr:VanW family protein [Clostridia bacterium]